MNNIRKYRVYKGLTQSALAKILGVSLSGVRYFEQKGVSKVHYRKKICEYFGVSEGQMF